MADDTKLNRMKYLVEKLNKASFEYYALDNPSMTDKEYDKLYDELETLEKKLNVTLASSPTQKVQGYVLDKFEKVEHSKPMLSANKTKDTKEIEKFVKGKDFYASYKLDGCFTSSCRVSMADGTYKRINDIKVGDYVLSCNKDGVVESKKVTNVFYNGFKKQDEWITIVTEKGNMFSKSKSNMSENSKKKYGGTMCTKNHLFYSSKGYVSAGELNVGDIIYRPYRCSSEKQSQIILGMLLGDGCFANRSKTYSNILEVHTSKTKNKGYDNLIYKYKNLFSSFYPKITERTSGYSQIKNNMMDINFHAISLPSYFVNNDNHLRCGLTFTKEILNNLTPLSLAIYYLDDGSLIKSQQEGKNVSNKVAGATLHTNRHKYENVELLSKYLKSFGIDNYINLEKKIKDKNLGDGYVIRISSNCSYKFFDIISKYIPKEFREMKLPNVNKYQNCVEIKWWEEDDSYLGLAEEKISEIRYKEHTREHSIKAYDIEVEDNHNYFANNHLVHNCTLVTTYDNGEFVKGITRGNGLIGEDVTEQCKFISNLPMKIPYKERLELRGECVMSWEEFNIINSMFGESEKYKHPRNIASGTLRNLDLNVVKDRKISYVVFECVTDIGVDSKLDVLNGHLENFGFETVDFMVSNDINNIVENMKPEGYKYPVDGLVFEIDSRKLSESLGKTDKFERCRMALKWKDEEVESQLKNILWQVSKTGAINPVAEFEPIELDNTIVERASLHNLNIIEEVLGYPYVCQTVNVYKANMIIPQIASADKIYDGSHQLLKPPTHCPVCHKPTEIKQENATKILYCTNPYCKAKIVKRLEHFASRDAMNIDGLSEATIEYLVNRGWVEKPYDLYGLIYRDDVLKQWYSADGFGSKSVNKLLDAIEKSKSTSFTRFLYSLSIDLVGKTASKQIEQHISKIIKKNKVNMTVCEAFFKMITQKYNWSSIDGIGSKINKSIYDYFSDGETFEDIKYLSEQFEYDDKYLKTENNTVGSGSSISGKVFVVTGSVAKFKNRKELSNKIEELGGKVSGSVSSKTDYLINNDKESSSSKNKKAKELGVKIITEDEFIEMIK